MYCLDISALYETFCVTFFEKNSKSFQLTVQLTFRNLFRNFVKNACNVSSYVFDVRIVSNTV